MRELEHQEPQSSDEMQRSYFDHPSTDALERFILHRCSEDELELVETHILACESCVGALENLEVEIASTKLALKQVGAQQSAPVLSAQPERKSFLQRWFSVPTLSWAGVALTACAFCLIAFLPANINLNADRDNATLVVPEWRSVHLHLHDGGLPLGALRAEVANDSGSILWSGAANNVQGDVELHMPRMTHVGVYYARLYTPWPEHELLNEFRFEVKLELF